MKKANAEVLREYGPFSGAPSIGGVSYDGWRRTSRRFADAVRAIIPTV